jgi:DNA-binding LytR/AlgR family response regulator
VSSFKRKDGKLVALIDDGREVPVSRERAKELRVLGM